MSDVKTGWVNPLATTKWNRPDSLPAAREHAEKCTDPLEKRIIILEAMLADMAYRLSYVNENFSALQDRMWRLERAYNTLMGQSLTSEELDLLRGFITFVREDTK